MIDRERLNALKSQRVGGEPEDEAEHFIQCSTCGQAIDLRKLGDVMYHEQPEHDPLPVS